jgi:type I restriction enzyme M protein
VEISVEARAIGTTVEGHHKDLRISIDRPLRLRFKITDDAQDKFLDPCPNFYDAMEALKSEFGSDWNDDWNNMWPVAKKVAEDAGAEWTNPNKKLFRSLFTTAEPTAEPVIAKRGE